MKVGNPSVLITVSLVFLYLSNFYPALSRENDQHEARIQSFEKVISKTVKLNYLLYLPSKYQEEEKWPLLIFLHGNGAQDDINMIRTYGPPKLIEEGRDFSYICLAPQLPGDVHWDPDALYALVLDIIDDYSIDENKIYLTGLSRGGFGTWEFAVSYPDLFAAIAPVCARGISGIERVKDIPIWIFHGEQDPGVPVQDSKLLYEELIAVNADVRITIYPDLGHDIWDRVYNDNLFWDWLFKQKK
jgi:predicted peptidase